MTQEQGSKNDRKLIKTAHDVLYDLELEHRNDLTLHLYSTYLLKKLILDQNGKKHLHESNEFIKKQIKDSWTRWPNHEVVLDPQIDKIYQDLYDPNLTNDSFVAEHNKIDQIKNNVSIKPREVSEKALKHSLEMFKIELQAIWDRSINKISKAEKISLNLDHMEIPKDATFYVMDKLEQLFQGLNIKMAQRNDITVVSDKNGALKLRQLDNIYKEKLIKGKEFNIRYNDILQRACEIDDNLQDIFMKSLKLYNDIPTTYPKNMYKLPSKVLKKYRYAKKHSGKIFKPVHGEYISLLSESLMKKDRKWLKVETSEFFEKQLSKMTFLNVQGLNNMKTKINSFSIDTTDGFQFDEEDDDDTQNDFSKEDQEDDDDEENEEEDREESISYDTANKDIFKNEDELIAQHKNWLKETEPFLGRGILEFNDDDYSILDTLVPIPRN